MRNLSPLADPPLGTGCCQPGAAHWGLSLSHPALTYLSCGTGNATAIPHCKAKLLQIPVGERTGKVGFEGVLSAAMKPRLSQSSHGPCPCSLACNIQRQQCCRQAASYPAETFLHPLFQIKHTVPNSALKPLAPLRRK